MQPPPLKLGTGQSLPLVGLGTWKLERATAAETVHEAIRSGYRHIDGACDYGNEAEVGAGLRQAMDAGFCRREDLWITSKLWNTFHRPEHVRPAVERSLRDLRLSYLDLYLVNQRTEPESPIQRSGPFLRIGLQHLRSDLRVGGFPSVSPKFF